MRRLIKAATQSGRSWATSRAACPTRARSPSNRIALGVIMSPSRLGSVAACPSASIEAMAEKVVPRSMPTTRPARVGKQRVEPQFARIPPRFPLVGAADRHAANLDVLERRLPAGLHEQSAGIVGLIRIAIAGRLDAQIAHDDAVRFDRQHRA